MKVYINARFLTQQITGVQRFALEICRALKILRTDIVFVSPTAIIHHKEAKELNVVTFGHLKGHLWEQIELPLYLLAQGKPLLLNLANTAPILYTNQIVTVHDLAFKLNPAWFSRSFSSYYNFLIPRITKKALKILTVSESSKQDLNREYKIPQDKIAVIYNAASSELQVTDVPFISGYEPYVLAVASLDPRKNFIKLIQAFKNLPNGNLKLLLVGGQNKNFSEALPPGIMSDANIVCLGYVSDEELAALYSKAEAFIYPSLYEGFGLPNIEAMHFGCPVITSDIAACREVCGNAATYIDPTNIAQLTGAIQQLTTDKQLKVRLTQAGLKQSQMYSWKDSAHKLTTIINNIVKTY